MIIVFDVGNTCTTIGFFCENELKGSVRMSTDVVRTGDQYAVDLYNLIKIEGFDFDCFDGAIAASVVPAVNGALKTAVKKVLGLSLCIVGPGVKTGLNIKIDNPAQLGADLAVGGVAAIAKYDLPCIIFDMGTANTISVINKKGEFLGGTISAGMGISLDALASKTAQLPYIELENPGSVIGTNTIESMKSGLVYGTAAMMDGMAERIEEELGERATLVATGGRAASVVAHCKRDYILNSDLLLEGLAIIYYKNREALSEKQPHDSSRF